MLEDVVLPNWKEELILVEDNDRAHGTQGKAENKIKVFKREHEIKWELNCSNSLDLNPIEIIQRIIKQRLKSRGVITNEAYIHRVIQEEWDKISLDEINKAISTMPKRVAAVNE